jgi:uncharacterized membrane protein (DUF373 family)
MPKDSDNILNVKPLRKIILLLDDLVHFAVALILLACAIIILVRTIPDLLDPGVHGIVDVMNQVLLALIVMELLWPVVRFLKRAPFRINPFLYVGIISSTRRILLIEAEHSMAAKAVAKVTADPSLPAQLGVIDWSLPIELGVNVGVILVLAIALYLIGEREDKPHTAQDG